MQQLAVVIAIRQFDSSFMKAEAVRSNQKASYIRPIFVFFALYTNQTGRHKLKSQISDPSEMASE
jgi:hypothetical protein